MVWYNQGGGTAGADLQARATIAQLLATPGTTPDILPNAGISGAGRQWQNQTAGIRPVPSTITEASMIAAGFTDVTAGGATDDLNITGPWTGAAAAGEQFGLDKATGKQYYVDNAGQWQPELVSGTFDVTLDTVATIAPAVGTVPVDLAAITDRDEEDHHVRQFTDAHIRYVFRGGAFGEGQRTPIGASRTHQLTIASGAFVLPESPTEAEIEAALPPTADSNDDVVYTSPGTTKIRFDLSLDGADVLRASRVTARPHYAGLAATTDLPAPANFADGWLISATVGDRTRWFRYVGAAPDTQYVETTPVGSAGGVEGVTRSTQPVQTAPFTASAQADETLWSVDVSAEATTSALAVALSNGTEVAQKVTVIDSTRACTDTRTVVITGLIQGATDTVTIDTVGGAVMFEWISATYGWRQVTS